MRACVNEGVSMRSCVNEVMCQLGRVSMRACQ